VGFLSRKEILKSSAFLVISLLALFFFDLSPTSSGKHSSRISDSGYIRPSFFSFFRLE